jgi:hypothetical protein
MSGLAAKLFCAEQRNSNNAAHVLGDAPDHRAAWDGRGRGHEQHLRRTALVDGEAQVDVPAPGAHGLEQKHSLADFFDWYNRRCLHQALGWQTPDEAYFGWRSSSFSSAAGRQSSACRDE